MNSVNIVVSDMTLEFREKLLEGTDEVYVIHDFDSEEWNEEMRRRLKNGERSVLCDKRGGY